MSAHEDFQITSSTDASGVTVVSIEGQIATTKARLLASYFRNLYSRGVRDVVVDLSGVIYASSAALAFFISACSGYTRDGFSFNAAFCNLPENVARTLESLGLAHLLRIAHDREAALKLLHDK